MTNGYRCYSILPLNYDNLFYLFFIEDVLTPNGVCKPVISRRSADLITYLKAIEGLTSMFSLFVCMCEAKADDCLFF